MTTLSNDFMSGVFGALGIVLYIVAPFLSDEKKALQFRLFSEALFALMFFYISAFAGVSYYIFMLASILIQKQIETNWLVSLIYGSIACGVTILFNNAGNPGIFLAGSLILVFLKFDEKKLMSFTSYIDFLTSLILGAYSFKVHAWVSFIFSILLILVAVAGIISAVKIRRSGHTDT